MPRRTPRETLLIGDIFTKLAPRIGAQIHIEPKWRIVGQIIFKNGNRSYFRYNTLDLNPVGASDVAKDKDYAAFFMQHMGYPTVPHSKTFFRKEWGEAIGVHNRTIEDACAYALRIGFPVIVKPNSGSQGHGVALAYSQKELRAALRAIFIHDRIALVQPHLPGKDYRLVVFDNTLISAYQRIPLNVTGDGKSSIKTLLKKKQRDFVKAGRDTRIDLYDIRIRKKLARQKLTLDSIPQKGTSVFLLDNANLSTGGDAHDVTATVHPQFTELAIRLTRDMGLRFCGVDLMINGDIHTPPRPGLWHILEINAAPGLDHYARSGTQQRRLVENLYLQVLRHLESGRSDHPQKDSGIGTP